MLLILTLIVLCIAVSAAALLSVRGQRGGDADRQIADLRNRIDQLEQSALSVTNELRRLEDSQRFTERLMSGRPTTQTGPIPPDDQ